MALKPWDAAAGSLIVLEAGAQITDMSGKPFDLFVNNGVAVSNGHVHAALVDAAVPMLDALAMEVWSLSVRLSSGIVFERCESRPR